jgi:hypothetical protein
VLYFIGALIAHLRKGDVKGLPAPTSFLILCRRSSKTWPPALVEN